MLPAAAAGQFGQASARGSVRAAGQARPPTAASPRRALRAAVWPGVPSSAPGHVGAVDLLGIDDESRIAGELHALAAILDDEAFRLQLPERTLALDRLGDRKSTRLNSSQ